MTVEQTEALEAMRPALHAFAWRLLGDAAAAEDAVQDCLLHCLGVRPDDLRAWTYRTLRNGCLNRLRAAGRRRDDARLATGFDPAGTRAGALTRMVRAEDGAAVMARFQRLSDNQREVLELRYVDGLSRGEIAAVLELPVAVVKSRLFEGVQRLRGLHGVP